MSLSFLSGLYHCHCSVHTRTATYCFTDCQWTVYTHNIHADEYHQRRRSPSSRSHRKYWFISSQTEMNRGFCITYWHRIRIVMYLYIHIVHNSVNVLQFIRFVRRNRLCLRVCAALLLCHARSNECHVGIDCDAVSVCVCNCACVYTFNQSGCPDSILSPWIIIWNWEKLCILIMTNIRQEFRVDIDWLRTQSERKWFDVFGVRLWNREWMENRRRYSFRIPHFNDKSVESTTTVNYIFRRNTPS